MAAVPPFGGNRLYLRMLSVTIGGGKCLTEFLNAQRPVCLSCATCRRVFPRTKCERAGHRRKISRQLCLRKITTTRDILRAPFDLVIKGNSVQFARPLFNLDGTRVIGTEFGDGTVDDDGRLHLTSEWGFLGNSAHGDYRRQSHQDRRHADGHTNLDRAARRYACRPSLHSCFCNCCCEAAAIALVRTLDVRFGSLADKPSRAKIHLCPL